MENTIVKNIVEEDWGTSTIYATSVPEMKSQDALKSREAMHSSQTFREYTEEIELKALESYQDTAADYFCLPYFQASFFATILEDSITQVRILVECNNEMRIIKTMADMTLLRALKYGVEQPPVKDELDGIDVHKLRSVEYSLNKLDRDRYNYSDILIATYKELSLNKCFRPLLNAVQHIVGLAKYEEYICEEEAKNRILRRELMKQLRQQRNHIKSVIYDADVIIDDLKTQVEDASLMAETRSRYVRNWQSARSEQHAECIHEKEFVNTDSIEYYKRRADHEQRVHSEVELLTNIVINETLQKVEDWMEKYEKDMEQIDLKIQIKKNDYQNMLDKRINFETTIEKHDKQMKDWNTFKDEREKARQYEIKMTKSAIIVQAWWRGMLVRRELGPYRVVKRRGAAKKK